MVIRMRCVLIKAPAVLISFLLFTLISSAYGAVIYVDCDAPGPTHDGTSWKKAFKSVSEALGAEGEDVWIRTGTYQEQLVLTRSVNLYGGFLGGEKSLDQRIPGAFPTVLDAGLKGRVLEIARGCEAIIDGLTIMRGVGNVGGGILVNTNAVGHIRNCRIEHCEATSSAGGGGVYYAKYAGAMDGSDWGEMRDCVISHNQAPKGGGVVVEHHAYAGLVRCVVTRNKATESGGGLHLPFHSGADLTNCTIAYNSAGVNGGGVYIHYGGPHTLSKCIVAFNSAPTGGGLFGGPANKQLTMTYTECNLFGNSGGDRGGNVKHPSSYPGNISSDPLFISPESEEYRLKANSPSNGIGAFPLEKIYRIDRLETVRALRDGDEITLSGKVVSRVEGDTTYVREAGGSEEVAIRGITKPSPGDILASVTGTLSTGANGERVLNASSHSVHAGFSYNIKPSSAK